MYKSFSFQGPYITRFSDAELSGDAERGAVSVTCECYVVYIGECYVVYHR